jgi:hypothetical protein
MHHDDTGFWSRLLDPKGSEERELLTVLSRCVDRETSG